MRLAVLVSGTGTNLGALLAAEEAGELAPGEVVLVVSNRPGVPALARASAAGKPALALDHKAFVTRDAFEDELAALLAAHGVQAIVLAGFMRVLGPGFLARFPDRVLNLHPSLLPAFPGLDAVGQALAYGVRVTGATVHLVTDELDGGPIVLQASVPVLEGDDAATLGARVREREHELLPHAVRLLASGRLRREGRRIRIDDPPGASPGGPTLASRPAGHPR